MKEVTDMEKTIWFAVFIVEVVIIVISNILSVIIFARKVRQCKPCLLLINQSLADFLVGVMALVYILQFASVEYAPPNKPTKDECRPIQNALILALLNFVLELSLASLALISLDRAFAVFKPFQHRVLKSKHYYYGILATWCLSLVPASCMIILRCESFGIQYQINMAVTAISVFSTLLILIFAYLSVYIKIKYFPVFQRNSQDRSQMKLSLMLFFASVASMSTVIPSSTIQLYFYGSPFTPNHPNNILLFALFLVFANSFINFAIYAWRFPGFADDLKKFFCCTPKRVMNNSPSIQMSANAREPTANDDKNLRMTYFRNLSVP